MVLQIWKRKTGIKWVIKKWRISIGDYTLIKKMNTQMITIISCWNQKQRDNKNNNKNKFNQSKNNNNNN